MNAPNVKHKIFPSLFVALIFCLLTPRAAFGQTEKLGVVQYMPPSGWTKTAKVANVVAYSNRNQTTGGYCIITLYGATPGTGNAKGDFTREWNNLVAQTLKAEANPQTETQSVEGWTIMTGGAAVEMEGSKALAFLTVFTDSGRTVSVLGVLNDQSFLAQLEAFIKSIDIEKAAAAPAAAVNPPTEGGKVVIPLPTRQLTVADLAGEWGETAGFSTTYVDRHTGAYAGTDSLHFRNKMTFTKSGGYANNFFAIRNGQKIIDNTVGTVTIVGRVLSIKEKNTAKYVVRGWLELPDMTIMTVCGPWYDDDEIPANIFTNPEQGANLNKNWIRKK